MKISVTQDHIDRGKKHSTTCCPVALALIEGAGWTEPYVFGFGLQDGMRVRSPLTEEVVEFTNAFDQGEVVKPFEFNLERP